MSVYTERELESLGKYKEYRDLMIEELFKEGVPSAKQMRVANEILAANEKSIHDTVTNRLKYQENANKEAIVETVSAVLRSIRSKVAEQVIDVAPEAIDVDNEYIPVDIVPGETDIAPDALDPSDFIQDTVRR